MDLMAAGFVCVSLLLGACFLWDRWQRSAFVEDLSLAERERLQGFEAIKGSWRDFRKIRQRLEHHPDD
jgi:hypothetical protein